MQLTDEVLRGFIGGQLEIQNQVEEYIYRGEVEEVNVVGEDLVVKFKWFAKGEGFPLPDGWKNQENKTYSVNLMMANPNHIGQGCLSVNTGFISNELLVFFPPGGSRLDSAKVKGLKL